MRDGKIVPIGSRRDAIAGRIGWFADSQPVELEMSAPAIAARGSDREQHTLAAGAGAPLAAGAGGHDYPAAGARLSAMRPFSAERPEPPAAGACASAA